MSVKTIRLQETLDYPTDVIWSIISDITRSDWVPSVDTITAEGNIRSFVMAGIGEVQEKILALDHDKLRLQYSAIKTPSMVAHHLATLQLRPVGGRTEVTWTTEIEPDEFAPAIEHGMRISLQGLQAVLASPPGKPDP